jgi:hypothetical protein
MESAINKYEVNIATLERSIFVTPCYATCFNCCADLNLCHTLAGAGLPSW